MNWSGSAITRVGEVLRTVHQPQVTALGELQKKPEFKEAVKVAGSAADVAGIFDSVQKDYLMGKFKLSPHTLTRIAGAAGIVVGVIEAIRLVSERAITIAVLGL